MANMALTDAERGYFTDALQRVQWGLATDAEKYDLFDELAEKFGHNSLAESLTAFGL